MPTNEQFTCLFLFGQTFIAFAFWRVEPFFLQTPINLLQLVERSWWGIALIVRTVQTFDHHFFCVCMFQSKGLTKCNIPIICGSSCLKKNWDRQIELCLLVKPYGAFPKLWFVVGVSPLETPDRQKRLKDNVGTDANDDSLQKSTTTSNKNGGHCTNNSAGKIF